MIEQTIPLQQLTAGMARCVREWILPHLADSMARIQAEQLIALLEALPRAVDPAAMGAIRADSDEARALLLQAAAEAAPPAASDRIEDLMAENASLKEQLEGVADRCRFERDERSAQTLAQVQAFFVRSVQREAAAAAAAQDFQKLTARDRAGKQE